MCPFADVGQQCRSACGLCRSPTSSPAATPAPSAAIRPGECVDRQPDSICAGWVGNGQCVTNPLYMAANCQRSCGLCSSAPFIAPPTPVPTFGPTAAPSTALPSTAPGSINDCSDLDSPVICASWATAGLCSKADNIAFMRIHCRKSCGFCTDLIPVSSTPSPTIGSVSDCYDVEGPRCAAWVRDGQCKSNPAMMATSCRLSCGVCSGPTIMLIVFAGEFEDSTLLWHAAC
jgi:hypothetical protein